MAHSNRISSCALLALFGSIAPVGAALAQDAATEVGVTHDIVVTERRRLEMIRTANRNTALKLVLGIADGVDPARVTSDFTWWIQGQGAKSLVEFNGVLAASASLRVGRRRLGVREVTSEGVPVAIELEGLTPLTGQRLYNNSYHFLVPFSDGVPCGIWEYYSTAYAADTFAGGGLWLL